MNILVIEKSRARRIDKKTLAAIEAAATKAKAPDVYSFIVGSFNTPPAKTAAPEPSGAAKTNNPYPNVG